MVKNNNLNTCNIPCSLVTHKCIISTVNEDSLFVFVQNEESEHFNSQQTHHCATD